LHHQKFNEGQVISRTGPKPINRPALKSEKETKLYSLHIYRTNQRLLLRYAQGITSEVLKAGNLSSLFVDDPEFSSAALDALLKSLKYNDCES
jgi:hypothetical protein